MESQQRSGGSESAQGEVARPDQTPKTDPPIIAIGGSVLVSSSSEQWPNLLKFAGDVLQVIEMQKVFINSLQTLIQSGKQRY